jgi:hypothetical protein
VGVESDYCETYKEGCKLPAGSAVSSPNVKLPEWMIERIVIKTLTKLHKNLRVIVKINLTKPVRPEKSDI